MLEMGGALGASGPWALLSCTSSSGTSPLYAGRSNREIKKEIIDEELLFIIGCEVGHGSKRSTAIDIVNNIII